MYKDHNICRICGNTDLTQYLDLGLLPLSNNLCFKPDEEAQRYPLKVLYCSDCSLSQLSIVIDPGVLFGHYVYRSSISQVFKDHCNDMARELKKRYGLTENSFVIDIAGNDGALLSEFKKEIGCTVLNVDPAVNLVEINDQQGIRMFNTFWGAAAAEHLVNTGWPKADVITATNVIAHVDNVKEFLLAAKAVLKSEGVLVLEFPYMVDMIDKVEFDTIYFEHVSYFGINSLGILCNQLGLKILNVTKQDIHGGSVRCIIGQGKEDETSVIFSGKEVFGDYTDIKKYQDFAKKVKIVISNFRSRIKGLKEQGYKIAAFAASAKGNTLLNCAGITRNEIDYIIDQTPEKIGKYSPGTGILIDEMARLYKYPPDFLVILSWNFKEEIINKCRKAGYTGKFILPLTFEVIGNDERGHSTNNAVKYTF